MITRSLHFSNHLKRESVRLVLLVQKQYLASLGQSCLLIPHATSRSPEHDDTGTPSRHRNRESCTRKHEIAEMPQDATSSAFWIATTTPPIEIIPLQIIAKSYTKSIPKLKSLKNDENTYTKRRAPDHICMQTASFSRLRQLKVLSYKLPALSMKKPHSKCYNVTSF